MPASPDARIPEGPVHPHPITPQHQRIFAENRLIGGLNGAMDVKDVPAMRRFLEQYRREYPEDNEMLQDGYAVIADCFEHPGAQARAAAERWVQTHNGSTLKRFVNRHCLEPPRSRSAYAHGQVGRQASFRIVPATIAYSIGSYAISSARVLTSLKVPSGGDDSGPVSNHPRPLPRSTR